MRFPIGFAVGFLAAAGRDAFERRQRLLRVVVEQLSRQRLGELDEYFWTALRDAYLAAGATPDDISALAAFLAAQIVEWTAPASAARREQFQLIAEHLACADMTIRIAPGDASVGVEFPDAPKVH